LIDVFAYKKEQLAAAGEDISSFPPKGFAYTSEDLEDAVAKQGLKITDFEPGDVIYVRTGDAYKWWTEDPDKPRNDRQGFFDNQANVDDRAGQWVVNRGAVAYASDTSGGPHSTLMPQGVTLIEDLDLELLAKDAAAIFARTKDGHRAYIFTTIFQPLRCRGCSGSAVAPVALR
jgi:kynurenine formamidase